MKLLCLFIIGLIFSPLECVGQTWISTMKQLEISKSTRTDVERVFDISTPILRRNLAETEINGWTELLEYETRYGDLEVKFSIGGCSSQQNKAGYDVPAGRLVLAILYPAKPMKIGVLGYDLSRFRIERVNDVDGAFEYDDFERGISLSVLKGRVTRIQFDLSKDQLELDCRNPPTVLIERADEQSPPEKPV